MAYIAFSMNKSKGEFKNKTNEKDDNYDDVEISLYWNISKTNQYAIKLKSNQSVNDCHFVLLSFHTNKSFKDEGETSIEVKFDETKHIPHC